MSSNNKHTSINIDSYFTFKKEFGLIIIGAIIFTASFLWKDLLVDIEDLYFPKSDGLLRRFVFIMAITVILVIVSICLKNLLGINNLDTNIRIESEPSNDD